MLRSRIVLLCCSLLLCACPAPDDAARGVPEEVVRRNNLGTSYLSQQKWDEAVTEFRAALALRERDALLLNNVAVALLQQGKPDEAEASLRRAVELESDHPYANYNLGLIEKNRGNFEASVEHFRIVVEHDDADVFSLYNLGTALDRLEQADEAERTLRRALALNPTHVSTLYALGRHLLQQGRTDEGTRMITLSQEIRSRSGLDEAVGNQYGEQGPYAMGADYPGDALAAPPPIEVTFRPAAAVDLAATPVAWIAGPGLHVLDQNGGSATLQGEAPAATPDPAARGRIRDAAAGDVDEDGEAEIVAVRETSRGVEVAVLGGKSIGRYEVAPGDRRYDLALVDRDHDGDLDVLVCWSGVESRCEMATNDGSGTFAPHTGHGVGAPGDGHVVQVGFSDLDNDRDVDLIVLGSRGLRIYSNARDGSFSEIETGLAAASFAVADLTKDGRMDLVLAGDDGPALAANAGRMSFDAPRPLADGAPASSANVVAVDFDNDGFIDVAATDHARLDTEGNPIGRVTLLRNLGAGGWSVVATFDGAAVLAADADEDGDLDLAGWHDDAPALWTNEGGDAHYALRVSLSGVGDNHFGIGTKVEVLAGALRQKFEITRPGTLLVGLGSRERADAVRLLWPGGVLQDELNQAAGEPLAIAQLDRKGTSCPILYAWSDGAWRFVTDFLGGAAVGYQHAPGVYSTPDTDEYVLIEGGLDDEDGSLRLRLNNQLEEVIWFDQAQLVVVDHPDGTQVYPNERLMPGPPWPEFRLYASDDVRPIAAARDVERDRDVTDLLTARDRRTVGGFALKRFKGYAEPHTLELDLGPLPAGRRVVLLLDGWIDYADSTANVGAVQAGLSLQPPVLYAADGNGGWRELTGVMGFPAGLPKTMSVDLTGHLGAEARLRIATNMRIYWDRARVMVGGDETPLEVRRLNVSSAELRFGGYPRPFSPDGAKPRMYDPADVRPGAMWKAHAGAYTAFGDVRGPLEALDDRLVTTKHGDEIELAFAAPPTPRPGFTRSYLLFADGFGKDMDPNSAANDRVGPVPFHGMPRYPYADGAVPPHDPPAAARQVLPSADGLHGAAPLPLVASEQDR